jgi:hypothetical protein
VLLVPHLDVDHASGRDLLWCASFDLAWRALSRVVGGPISLRYPQGVDAIEADRAMSLVRALDASPVREEVAPPAWYLALAGEHTRAWVEDAERRLRERFGELQAAFFPAAPQPGLLVAYAYADVHLPFSLPFAPVAEGMFFAGVPVAGFGVWDPASSEERSAYQARVAQVLVHHHRFAFEYDPERAHEDEGPSEEFVIELESSNLDGRVIVACCMPERSLAGTVALTLSRLRDDVAARPDARLRTQEKLHIPCIDLDETRRYGELYGQGIDNPGFEQHVFGEVLERVRFVLDEGGARVISEALFGGLSLPPRSFLCTDPFLVLVLRRGARLPFLALWVETAEALRKR